MRRMAWRWAPRVVSAVARFGRLDVLDNNTGIADLLQPLGSSCASDICACTAM